MKLLQIVDDGSETLSRRKDIGKNLSQWQNDIGLNKTRIQIFVYGEIIFIDITIMSQDQSYICDINIVDVSTNMGVFKYWCTHSDNIQILFHYLDTRP